jgi:putative addiction module component (TIGR02574 family)
MSEQTKQVIAAALALPLADRKLVADAVCDSIDAEDDEEMSDEEYHDMWGKEIERRLADLEAGRTKLIPHEEVMARLREKYG